jgi:hypothetical protein
MSRLDPVLLIVAVLGGLVINRRVRPKVDGYFRRKYESTNRVECGLRRDQPDEIITGRWMPGLATLSPGQIDFQPRSSLGLRLNSGAPFVIPVLSASTTVRRPSWRQVWRMYPRLKIVMLETATGPIELAVSRESIQLLVNKVNQTAQ